MSGEQAQAAHIPYRGQGATKAKRYLKRLCERSFLSLWSYPGIYRDQKDSGSKGDGKEVCDLLVVFQNHIIIFSDKDCEFPNTGNLDLDWSRWYRRAIQASAKQIWGAERWIRDHPDRLFLDPACEQPFPIDLPNPNDAKFHRILVAHGVSKVSNKIFGGSGSLIIKSDLVGTITSKQRLKTASHLLLAKLTLQKAMCMYSMIHH